MSVDLRCLNHETASPSFSILMHEIFQLTEHAKRQNVPMDRVGTSEDIGVPAETVVGAINDLLRENHEEKLSAHHGF